MSKVFGQTRSVRVRQKVIACFCSLLILQVTFGDFAPYMILAEDSLAMLNKELPLPMEMERFRPNIVVAGLGAFEEVSLPSNVF